MEYLQFVVCIFFLVLVLVCTLAYCSRYVFKKNYQYLDVSDCHILHPLPAFHRIIQIFRSVEKLSVFRGRKWIITIILMHLGTISKKIIMNYTWNVGYVRIWNIFLDTTKIKPKVTFPFYIIEFDKFCFYKLVKEFPTRNKILSRQLQSNLVPDGDRTNNIIKLCEVIL